jgi:hypothetical protein
MDCWGGPDNQIHCQYLSPYDLSRCTSGLGGKAESTVVGCLQRHGHVSFARCVLCMAVTTLCVTYISRVCQIGMLRHYNSFTRTLLACCSRNTP